MKNLFSRLKKIGSFNLIICIAGIMLLLTVSVLFGYGITSKGLIQASSKQVNESYYLLELDCFENYIKAKEFAKTIQNKGGAGFISYDNGFKVFASAYNSYDEAEKVITKQTEYKNAKVYKLNLASFNANNGLSTEQNKIIKNNIISFKYCIENYASILNKLNKNEIDEAKFKEHLVLIQEEIEIQTEKFNSIFTQSSTMYKYKNYLLEFLQNVTDIISLNLTGLNFKALAHYNHISLIYCLNKILTLV